MEEWFPVQILLQDQLGSFLKIQIVEPSNILIFSQSSPHDSSAQSSQFTYLPVLQPWVVAVGMFQENVA